MSTLVVVVLVADGSMMLFVPGLLDATFQKEGMPMALAPVLGTIALASGVLYAFPQTAVLGAIVITGFLGGAICTHVRIGVYDVSEVVGLTLGALAWGGLYLRDARLRALLPLRSRSTGVEPASS